MAPVNVDDAVWVLTGLALLVVVLTRLRLSARTDQSGVARVPQSVLNGHTVAGLLAVLVWAGYLTRVGNELNLIVGAIALLLWWIETLIGLLILSRWRAARGRHASPSRGDRWGSSAWLSALAHVGMLGAAGCFTALFVSDLMA